MMTACISVCVCVWVQVMTAASYWSLLAPAIEMAAASGLYGHQGQWAFVPVAMGFTLGAAFVYWADAIVPSLVGQTPLLLYTRL